MHKYDLHKGPVTVEPLSLAVPPQPMFLGNRPRLHHLATPPLSVPHPTTTPCHSDCSTSVHPSEEYLLYLMWTSVFDLDGCIVLWVLGHMDHICTRSFSVPSALLHACPPPYRSVLWNPVQYIGTLVHSVETPVGLSNWTHPCSPYILALKLYPKLSRSSSSLFLRYRTKLLRLRSETSEDLRFSVPLLTDPGSVSLLEREAGDWKSPGVSLPGRQGFVRYR